MKTIVHACSSVLVRPNGIVRYINTVTSLQQSLGHTVIFATDATPTEVMTANTLAVAEPGPTKYVPNFKDGHVWLQVDADLVARLVKVFTALLDSADLVIVHDLHSYLAASQVFKDGIFIQHEADILTGARYSYISDEYMQQQINCISETNWRVGVTIPTNKITAKRIVFAPVPFVVDGEQAAQKTRGLLYVGDASDRKGAREFMAMANRLDVTPTVITHEKDNDLFAGAAVFSFRLDQRDEMMALIKKHKVAYLPSKSECPGIAMLECLQYMPVVLDAKYPWTGALIPAGAYPIAGEEDIAQAIQHCLDNPDSYKPDLLNLWASNAAQLWTNLTT